MIAKTRSQCSIVRTHLQSSHVEAGSLLIR